MPAILLVFFLGLLGTGPISSLADYIEPIYERIITDIRDVTNGVPIDYTYNDTSSVPGGLRSVSGCPKNEKGYPWVYYNSLETSMTCYLAGERGPCEEGQKLFVERGTPFGYCNCDCFEGVVRGDISQQVFCKRLSSNIRYVFYPDVKKCYTLFDQGPCKDNEWLTELDNVDQLASGYVTLTKCEERRCPPRKLPVFSEDLTYNYRELSKCVEPITEATSSQTSNSCNDFQQYSGLLKKCVNRNFSFIF